jgi:tellurite resistance protein TerC
MEFMMMDWLGKPVWMWLAFVAIVLALLALDLGVLHRKQREIGVTESLLTSAVYIALGLAFGAWVWWYMGATAGMNYVTGFVIEKSLAMDNVFVIAMIFAHFGIPRLYQHRVLFWGILGVIVLRAVMIGFGAAAVQQWDWVLYLFAGFLILTGIKMWATADKPYDVGSSPLLRWIRGRFRVTWSLHGEKFWVRQSDPATGRPAWFMTPLFLALLMVEFVDVGPGDLRDHDGSVHRLHLEHLRDPRSACALLRARRDGRPVPLSEVRAQSAARLHRLEDLRRRRTRSGEGSASGLARCHLCYPRRGRRMVLVEDAAPVLASGSLPIARREKLGHE